MVDPNSQPTVQWLREVKLFSVLNNQELEKLLKIGNMRAFDAYANIIVEGEFSWGLFLICQGSVGIYKKNPSSEEVYDVGELHSGGFFGEMSLVDEHPRSATVRAKTSCQLFFISKEAFKQFLAESPDTKLRFYENCVKDLVGRIRELDGNYVVSQYQLWHSALQNSRGKGAA
jgi:CRP-like cAMP-binding protein